MNITVCIFDDNKKVRDALGMIIKGTAGLEWGGGFRDCSNLMNDYKKCMSDVVLMDIQMPELDGIEAAKLLRENGFYKIPIIAMTFSSHLKTPLLFFKIPAVKQSSVE